MSAEPTQWPRIRDLPERERELFTRFLEGQTRPWVTDVPEADQDFYYPWDYQNWKKPTFWD